MKLRKLFLILLLLTIVTSLTIGCTALQRKTVETAVEPEQGIVILGPKRNLSKLWEEISASFPLGPTRKVINAFNINDGNPVTRRSFEQWIYEKTDENGVITSVIIISLVDGKLDNIITIPQ